MSGDGCRRLEVLLRHPPTWRALAYGIAVVPVAVVDVVLLSTVVVVPTGLLLDSAAHLMLLILGVDPSMVTAVREPTGDPAGAFHYAGIIVIALLLLAIGAYPLAAAAEGQRRLCRALLSARDSARSRSVDDVARSRARISSAFDEERRRIERDLHDGAQQRLTALVVSLGTMKYRSVSDDDIGPLIDRAMADARAAVVELREIVDGIYPAALRDRDLAGALDELASRAEQSRSLTVLTDLRLPDKIPSEVEVGLYFAVSELVTNVTRHSGATTLEITAASDELGHLLVTVQDDGRGGAYLGGGSGLVGVADRIETLGGHVWVSSPPGGPTTVVLEVPCVS